MTDTVLPRELLDNGINVFNSIKMDIDIPNTYRSILLKIASLVDYSNKVNNKDFAFVKQETLALHVSRTIGTVKRAISWLKKKGYIIVSKLRKINIYYLPLKKFASAMALEIISKRSDIMRRNIRYNRTVNNGKIKSIDDQPKTQSLILKLNTNINNNKDRLSIDTSKSNIYTKRDEIKNEFFKKLKDYKRIADLLKALRITKEDAINVMLKQRKESIPMLISCIKQTYYKCFIDNGDDPMTNPIGYLTTTLKTHENINFTASTEYFKQPREDNLDKILSRENTGISEEKRRENIVKYNELINGAF